MIKAPGWYPDPDGSASPRWWNGTQWTDDRYMGLVAEPVSATAAETVGATTPAGAATKGWRQLPKWVWAVAAAVIMLVVAGSVVMAMGLASTDNQPEATPTRTASPATAAPTQAPKSVVTAPVPAQPAAPLVPTPSIVPLGTSIASKNFTITVHSAEVTDTVQTRQGAPLVAEPGTDLVLVKSTFTVTGPDAVDLSCGSYIIFIRGYDSAGGQMAETFETSRIPGNPECNRKIVTGQTTEFNFAYRMTEGRQPDNLVIIDTDFYGPGQWGSEVVAALR